VALVVKMNVFKFVIKLQKLTKQMPIFLIIANGTTRYEKVNNSNDIMSITHKSEHYFYGLFHTEKRTTNSASFSTTTKSATTLSMTTFSIMTLSKTIKNATLSIMTFGIIYIRNCHT